MNVDSSLILNSQVSPYCFHQLTMTDLCVTTPEPFIFVGLGNVIYFSNLHPVLNCSSHWTPTAINQEASLLIPVLFPTMSAFSQFPRKKYCMGEGTSKLGIRFWSNYMYLTPWGWTVCAPLLFLCLASLLKGRK